MANVIIRGLSYRSNEFVTSTKLHQLVDSASISGLGVDNFQGDIRGLVQSTPASIGDGTVFYFNEPRPALTHPSALGNWNEQNYLTFMNGKTVSLFNPNGLETARFVTPDPGTFGPGAVLLFEDPGTGVTLETDSSGLATSRLRTIGGVSRVTHPAADTCRIHMIGVGTCNTDSTAPVATTWLDTLYAGGIASSVWTRSTASDNAGWFAYKLNAATQGGVHRQQCWMMGAPCFRL